VLVSKIPQWGDKRGILDSKDPQNDLDLEEFGGSSRKVRDNFFLTLLRNYEF